ncbi:MAG: phosphatidylserine decarboxylase family protein [Phycisphaeraceae bacterium]|nr:phosphatidylserine decarboxylase family protein [Phycisphaeraceae bacterium]
MLSRYGRNECVAVAVGCLLLLALLAYFHWWIPLVLVALLGFALLAFFRDPRREIPAQRSIMVSPADGKVTLIDRLEHFEPLDGPAIRIRIFLSVLDVHVNRSPCHAMVRSITPSPGTRRNALYADSAQTNESVLMVLEHPARRVALAAVKQIVGAIARRIVCDVEPGKILQRGQRYGMIKFGSTTELYIAAFLEPEITVNQGQRVYGGSTVLAVLHASVADKAIDQESAQNTASTPEPESVATES